MPITPPGQILWTAVPNGWSIASDGSDVLNMSLVVSPHLTSASATTTLADPVLALFQDWPAAVNARRFLVSFSSLTIPVEAQLTSPAADSNLWKSLFPPSLPVKSYGFDPEGLTGQNRQINSYAVKENLGTLEGGYHQPPPGHGLPELVHPLVRLARLMGITADEQRTVRAELDRLKRAHGTLTAAHIAQAQSVHPDAIHFAALEDYYSGLAAGARNRYQQNGNTPIAPPVLDFHQALSGLGRYPQLMRALGLILDLSVPARSVASAAPDDFFWIAPDPDSDTPAFAGWSQATPTSAYHLDGNTKLFYSRTVPSGGTQLGIDARMLFLPVEDDWTATSVDLDHLARGASGTLPQIRKQLAAGVQPQDVTVTVPAPRSSGLLFTKAGLAAQIQSTLAAQSAMSARLAASSDGFGVNAGAEELLRGFRVDISADGGMTWLSLCKRAVTHAPAGGTAVTYEDEGYIPLRVFNPDLDTNPLLWTHESLFRWTGWSLCVPRPGLAIDDGGKLVGDEDQGSSNIPMITKVTPPAAGRTLPRLRYGSNYSCRLRAVDLAGNSLALKADIDAKYTLDLGAYLRFDPILAPSMLLKHAAGPGEFVERLVIHSDVSTASSEIAERFLAPPKTSIEAALWHGALDTAAGVDGSAYRTLVDLDGTFPDAPYGDVDPAIPYLPDPIARGASFDLEPDGSNPQSIPLRAPFLGTWPRLQGVRLRLQEGTGDPVVGADGSVTFFLPKAGVQRLNLACFAADDDFNVFDYIIHFKEHPRRPGDFQRMLVLAQQSRLVQITPPRLLTLVHAVQRPLAAPTLTLLPVHTGNIVGLAGTITVHGASTAAVDFFASWEDFIDDGVNPPFKKSFMSRVDQKKPLATDALIEVFHHDFHDTKYRRVTYWAVATTRFREYFPDSVTGVPSDITQTSAQVVVDVPSSARPPAPKVLYVVPSFAWTQSVDDMSATHNRLCGLRVYLDRPWHLSGAGEQLGVVVAAKQVPPGDDGGGGGGGKGGGGPFPQFLAAPQATASDDPQPPGFMDPAVAPYLTQWGSDPAFASVVGIPTPFSPLPSRFVNKAGSWSVFDYADAPLNTLLARPLVTYEVQFEPPDPSNPQAPANLGTDPHNGRWYADIQIDADAAYSPFIRLALVRFQPNGAVSGDLSGAPLSTSNAVLSDFVQLAPGRAATVTFDPANPSQVHLVVTGASYLNNFTAGDTARPEPRMTVDIQVNMGGQGTPLWIQPAGAPQVLGRGRLETSNSFFWSGNVTLPFPRGSRGMRLLVRESEILPADSGTQRQRLVYADAFEL